MSSLGRLFTISLFLCERQRIHNYTRFTFIWNERPKGDQSEISLNKFSKCEQECEQFTSSVQRRLLCRQQTAG